MEKKTLGFHDKLTGALIGLVRATEGNDHLVTKETTKLIIEGLYTTISNEKFGDEELKAFIDKIHAEKYRLVPDCSVCASPCGRTADYNMELLWNAKEEICFLKSRILSEICEMAVCACQTEDLGNLDDAVNDFFYKALFSIGMDYDAEELLPIAQEAVKMKENAFKKL